MRQSEAALAGAYAYKAARSWRGGQNVHGSWVSNSSENKLNKHRSMSEMEIEEGPTDPTDPVDKTSPADNGPADLTQTETREIVSTPPHASEMEPIMMSSPVITSGRQCSRPCRGGKRGTS